MNPSELSSLVDEAFSLVRESCGPSLWSRGVECARNGLVALDETSTPQEVVLHVQSNRQGVIAQRVTLWPDEAGWECTCGGSDPCEHIAAAVIAARNKQCSTAPSSSPASSSPVSGWQVSYRFKRAGDSLILERWLIGGPGAEQRLQSNLRQFVGGMQSGRVPYAPTRFTQDDFAIDAGLEGSAPRSSLRWVVQPLSRCPHVSLDGASISISRAPTPVWIEIQDEGDLIRARLASDEGPQEVFLNGLVLQNNTLSPCPELPLADEERRQLGGPGLVLSRSQLPALHRFLTEQLPGLSQRLEVRNHSRNLPAITPMPPRIVWTVEDRGNGRVWALPEIVYGDPPLATIRGSRFVLNEPPRGKKLRELPARNLAAEAHLHRTLLNEFSTQSGTPILREGDATVELCQRIGGDATLPGLQKYHVVGALTPRLTVSDTTATFDFSLPPPNPDQAPSIISAEAVIAAWEQGRRYLPSPDGLGMTELPRGWLHSHLTQVKRILSELRESKEVPSHRAPELASLMEEVGGEFSGRLRELADLLAGKKTWCPSLPADTTVQLRDYQRVGWEWLMRLKKAGVGGILADDMGLGKTIQALLTLEGMSLVVCPTSVLQSWADHLATFRQALPVVVYHGQRRALPQSTSVVITTYGLLRRDIELFAAHQWDSVILDESQAIKNPFSQTAQAAYRVPAAWRLAMTGTPVENSPLDVWSQFRFAIPGLLPSLEHFQSALSEHPEQSAVELKRLVRPFILRRTKREVLRELPPKTEVTLRVPLREDERTVYHSLITAARHDLLERVDANISVMAVLEAILRLRQACCDVRLVTTAAPDIPSSKIETLIESLQEAIEGGHRCLVFSQWVSMLDLVEGTLKQQGISFLRLDGSTSNRGAVVREFQSAEGPPVFLISLKAGGVGLTLTAADHVFVLDPWWNPAVEEQATDRAHRIGQENPVFVYRIIAEDTIEERIVALQERKRLLARSLLEDGEGALNVSREELLELLG